MNRSATFAHLEVDGCEGEDRRTVSRTLSTSLAIKFLYFGTETLFSRNFIASEVDQDVLFYATPSLENNTHY